MKHPSRDTNRLQQPTEGSQARAVQSHQDRKQQIQGGVVRVMSAPAQGARLEVIGCVVSRH